MSTVNPTPYSVQDLSTTTVDNGNFVLHFDNNTTVTLTFSQLLLAMGLNSLGITRGTFNTQFAIAQERVSAMKELNDLVQAMNLYKNDFDANRDVTKEISTRNADLFKTLLGEMTTVTHDGKTYALDMNGDEVGPLDFIIRNSTPEVKVDASFNQIRDDAKLDQFKYILEQAELFLLLTETADDGSWVNRDTYIKLSIKWKEYHGVESGSGESPSGDYNRWKIPDADNLTPLTGDDLEFMKKICPLMQDAKDKDFGIIARDSNSGTRCYGWDAKRGEDNYWYQGSCFGIDSDSDKEFVKNQREAYQKMLNTPMQPSGLTLPEIYDISKKIKDAKSTTSYMKGADLQKLKDFMKKYPNTLDVDVDKCKTFTQMELETFLSNCQTAQSTLSSLNDQQGTRTNQAMQRSSGMLQTLQTMLQAANQARNSAASTGA